MGRDLQPRPKKILPPAGGLGQLSSSRPGLDRTRTGADRDISRCKFMRTMKVVAGRPQRCVSLTRVGVICRGGFPGSIRLPFSRWKGSQAERAEDGGGGDEHAERAGPVGGGAGRVEAPSGELEGENAEHGGLAGRQARVSMRLQMESRAAEGGEGAGGLAVRAGKGGEGRYRAEAIDDGVADVDDAEKTGLAVGAGALVQVEQGATRAPEFEEDRARERGRR